MRRPCHDPFFLRNNWPAQGRHAFLQIGSHEHHGLSADAQQRGRSQSLVFVALLDQWRSLYPAEHRNKFEKDNARRIRSDCNLQNHRAIQGTWQILAEKNA